MSRVGRGFDSHAAVVLKLWPSGHAVSLERALVGAAVEMHLLGVSVDV